MSRIMSHVLGYVLGCCGVATVMSSSAWAAKHSGYQSILAASAEPNLGLPSNVTILKVAPSGRTPRQLIETLIDTGAVPANGRPADQPGEGSNEFAWQGLDWRIRASADGSSANFRREWSGGYVTREARMSPSRLEELGREFITRHLRGIVEESPSDELLPFRSIYGIDAMHKVGEALPVEQGVYESTISFVRRHRGLPVISAGPSVSITFSNEGEVVAFSFDWPRYTESGETDGVVAESAFNERLTQLGSRSRSAGSAEQRRLCGYYDPGPRKRQAVTRLQPACFISYKVQHVVRGRVAPAGFAEVVPAGRAPLMDSGWRAASQLCAQMRSCRTPR